MTSWTIVEGLPVSGELAIGFAPDATRAHSQGLVVQFAAGGGRTWFGNFYPGHSDFSGVLDLVDRDRCVVIARGQAYIVDTQAHALVRVLEGTMVEDAMQLADERVVVLSDHGRL